MKVEKTFSVRASPQTVWDFAKDLEKMAPCIPGCKEITAVDAIWEKLAQNVCTAIEGTADKRGQI